MRCAELKRGTTLCSPYAVASLSATTQTVEVISRKGPNRVDESEYKSVEKCGLKNKRNEVVRHFGTVGFVAPPLDVSRQRGAGGATEWHIS